MTTARIQKGELTDRNRKKTAQLKAGVMEAKKKEKLRRDRDKEKSLRKRARRN